MRLTRAGVALASAGFSLFGLGVGMGNLELLLLGALPLLLVAVGLSTRATGVPVAVRVLDTTAPRRGEAFGMEVRVAASEANALVEVSAPLPATFRVENGANVALLAKPAPVTALMRLRAHARGRHVLPAVVAETIDPLGLAAPETRIVAPEATVEVAPRSHPIGRLRARARTVEASAMAEQDEARLGVDSTDFRELREYAWGDPPSAINWKATARRISTLGRRGGRHAHPIVNEYEKEGRRTVVVLLDGGPAMRVGTTLETGLDHGVEAALAAAKFFLLRGARVGAWTYGARGGPVAPPDSGSGQVTSLQRALSPGDEDAAHTLPFALRALQPHLQGSKPLVLVVTRVTPRNADELAEGARRLRLLVGDRRVGARAPMVVLDVRALDLAPAPSAAWESARRIVQREDEDAARVVLDAGARVVPWRPGREDFRKALHRGGLA